MHYLAGNTTAAHFLQIRIRFVRQRGRLTAPTPTLETNKQTSLRKISNIHFRQIVYALENSVAWQHRRVALKGKLCWPSTYFEDLEFSNLDYRDGPISFLVRLHKFQPYSQICIHIPMRLVWIFRSGRKEKSAEKEGMKIQSICTAFAFDLYSLLALIVYCSCIDARNIKYLEYETNKKLQTKVFLKDHNRHHTK